MKKTTSALLAIFLMACIPLLAQEESTEKEKIKKGWSFGAIPVVAYDSDIGFKYGGLVNFYDYGDGSNYPKYDQSIYLEWSRTTKGSGINQFTYDSEKLIPGVRMLAEASYLTEKALDFYGFNGAKSIFNADFSDQESGDNYISRAYYRYDRKQIMLKSDFWGEIIGKELRWYAGFQFNKIDIATVDVANINGDLATDDPDYLDPSQKLLYDKYVDWGLIKADQKEGGITTQLKLGFVYDTRDEEPNPTKGMWTEALVVLSPSFLGNDFAYSNLVLTHRQYIPIVENRLSAALRLSYQAKIGGETPFYMLPFYYSTFSTRDGLGGAKTIRGILRNRVVGESVGLGNAELRWKFFRGKFLGQNLYLALSSFLDAGMVLKEYELDLTGVDPDELAANFSTESERLHMAAGAGFHFVMNRNFIIAIDYGRALNEQDGASGLYIGLNFLY